MTEPTQFLQEAAAGLARAAGLSISFAKAAASFETIAFESNILHKVKKFRPVSVDEIGKLRTAAINLYNITRRGPSNNVPLLKLQLLACEAMLGPEGFSAASNEEVHEMDTMRCFSRTGLLLIGATEKSLGRSALIRCLGIAGNEPFEKITRIFGTSQEAHDCGAAFFAALCGICSLDLRTNVGASETYTEVEGSDRNETLSLLKANIGFIHVIHPTQQRLLRSILDGGIQEMQVKDSIPFQRFIFEEWEDMSSSTPYVNQTVAARLSYSLSRVGDYVGAVAALERAESIIIAKDQSPRDSTPSSMFLQAARVSVATSKYREETKIRDLVLPSSGELTEAGATTTKRLGDVRTEAFLLFKNFVTEVSLSNHEAPGTLRMLLDIATDLHLVSDDFDDTYGVLLSQFKQNVQYTSRILCQMLKDRAMCGSVWPSSSVTTDALKMLTSKCSESERARLCTAFWNKLCMAQDKNDWKSVAAYSDSISIICGDVKAMKSRATQAKAIAGLHIFLPDKTGDRDREIQVLDEAGKLATTARMMTDISSLRESAAVIELACIARRSAIDSSIGTIHLRNACDGLLKDGLLQPKSMLQVASDAETVGATSAMLVILESARDHLLNSHGNLEEVNQVTQKLILRNLALLRLSEAVEELNHWTEYVGSRGKLTNSEQQTCDDFRRWLRAKFQESAERGMSLLDGTSKPLNIASLLMAAAELSKDNSERDELLAAAAGWLVQTSLSAVETMDKSQFEASALISLGGENAVEALSKLSPNLKAKDARLGITAVLANMFMAMSVSDADEIVADRVIAICEDGEYAFPKKEGLEYAAMIARKLKLFKTARQLLVRVVQYELTTKQPDYNRIVGRCFNRLLADTKEMSDVKEWSEQIDNIANVYELSPEILEKAGITLWRKRYLLADYYLMKLALKWLEGACSRSDSIKSRRGVELEAIAYACEQLRNEQVRLSIEPGPHTAMDGPRHEAVSSTVFQPAEITPQIDADLIKSVVHRHEESISTADDVDEDMANSDP